MEQFFAFTVAHAEFFEPIGRRSIDRQFFEVARQLLPDSWILGRGKMWLMATGPTVTMANQGFKIHVSATVANATEVIRRVVPQCVAAGASFKLIADLNLLYLSGCKNFGRGASSKFITIYPPSHSVFLSLIEDLYGATKGIEGPYILSDMRYKDSSVVYYRYGGHSQMHAITVSGALDPVIYDPSGAPVRDERTPYYALPSWVEEPFRIEETEEDSSPCLLNGRYEIEAPLTYSNRGGVYLARDTVTAATVVVKEARRLTASWNGDGVFEDATTILRREHAILSSLQEADFVPRVIDLFEEWEHTFFVQELVPGVPLVRYRARHEVALMPFTGDWEKVRNFCEKFRSIALQLLDCVSDIHSRGMVLGDLSPSNILVELETVRVRLIDFEAAKSIDGAREAGRLWAVWAARGFASAARSAGTTITPQDDLYALGMVLYSLLTPVQALFDFEETAFERVMSRVEEITDLPPQIRTTITSLVSGSARDARDCLEAWRPEATQRTTRPEASIQELANAVGPLDVTVRRVADYIVSQADVERRDRLWPADYMSYVTNPLGVAYGACGTALFVHDVYGELPADVDRWLLAQETTLDTYAPGLFIGLAGVAQTFVELGHTERGIAVMRSAHESPLELSDPTMFHGAAGIGLADLYFRNAFADQEWLDHAVRIGEYLLRSAESREDSCCWRNSADGLVHLGFGYGASGVALFLLRLWEETGDDRFLVCARKGMAFDTRAAVDFAGLPKWVRFEGDALTEPYWLHGASGVGAALIRFAKALDSDEYLSMASAAADSAYSRFAVTPGQLEGLGGMAEFMLDMHQLTADPLYHQRALELAKSILCFSIERPTGLAFPGRQLVRISTDFGFGSAGVGAFFKRLTDASDRRWFGLQKDAARSPGMAP